MNKILEDFLGGCLFGFCFTLFDERFGILAQIGYILLCGIMFIIAARVGRYIGRKSGKFASKKKGANSDRLKELEAQTNALTKRIAELQKLLENQVERP